MRRLSGWAGAVALAAAVLGCGPEKQLPTVEGPGAGAGGHPPGEVIPTASDPEAKKLVDKYLAAATEGHPERLQKAKVASAVFSGGMVTEVTALPVRSTRRLQAVWPDRIHFVQDTQFNPPQTLDSVVRGDSIWVVQNGQPSDLPDPQGVHDTLVVEVTGFFWMVMLFPLAEPGTVVYEPRSQTRKKPETGEERTFDTVKVKLAESPVVFTLWFDPKAGELVRVEYNHREKGQPFLKAVELDKHQPFGGITLPTSLVSQRNNIRIEDWKVEKWEFPEKLGDEVFAEPKGAAAPK